MEEKVLIVRYGEIAMRGNNRKLFVTRLVNAIRKNLDDMGDYYVVREQGRLIVEDRGGEMDFGDFDFENFDPSSIPNGFSGGFGGN